MQSNLTDAKGNTTRVFNSFTGGGNLDASNSRESMLLVGNSAGDKTGTTNIISGTGNDNAIAGAGDVFANKGGIDNVNIKHTREGGGVTFNMTEEPSARATNNIVNYNPLLDFFRVTKEAMLNAVVRFIDGVAVMKSGNITNNFRSGNFRDLAQLDDIDETVVSGNAAADVGVEKDVDEVLKVDISEIIIDPTEENAPESQRDDSKLDEVLSIMPNVETREKVKAVLLRNK